MVGVKKMPFRIKCRIPVDIIIYANSLDAQIDLKQALVTHPGPQGQLG